MSGKMLTVLGGGLNENGSLPRYVSERCLKAKELWRMGDMIIASSSFTLNVPAKINQNGYLISEASQIYRKIKSELPSAKVLCEQFSHDTLGSICFIFLLYGRLYNFNKHVLITSDFHSERVRIISEYVRTLMMDTIDVEVIGLKSEFLSDVRFEKERNSIDHFNKYYPKFSSVDELIRDVLENHDNYNHVFGSKRTDLKNAGY